jgi:hypothetical protein
MTLPANLFESIRGKTDPAPAVGAARLELLVVVVPDGDATWIGFGPDEQQVVARLRGQARGEAVTLARRSGLEAFRSGSYAGGGFFTLRSFDTTLGLLGTGLDWSALPNKGEAPVLVSWSADHSPATARAHVSVPGAVLRDIAAIVAR